MKRRTCPRDEHLKQQWCLVTCCRFGYVEKIRDGFQRYPINPNNRWQSTQVTCNEPFPTVAMTCSALHSSSSKQLTAAIKDLLQIAWCSNAGSCKASLVGYSSQIPAENQQVNQLRVWTLIHASASSARWRCSLTMFKVKVHQPGAPRGRFRHHRSGPACENGAVPPRRALQLYRLSVGHWAELAQGLNMLNTLFTIWK